MKTNLHLSAPNALFANARHLRKNPAYAEALLWERLRANQTGFTFRRQHPLSNYIVDFYCFALKFVIEVDGPIHTLPMNQLEDENKDLTLESNGICVQRFTNEEVINDIDQVMLQMQETLTYLRNKALSQGSKGFSLICIYSEIFVPPIGGKGGARGMLDLFTQSSTPSAQASSCA